MEPYDPWNADPLRQPPWQQTYEEFEGVFDQIIAQLLDSRRFGEIRQPIKHEVYLTKFQGDEDRDSHFQLPPLTLYIGDRDSHFHSNYFLQETGSPANTHDLLVRLFLVFLDSCF